MFKYFVSLIFIRKFNGFKLASYKHIEFGQEFLRPVMTLAALACIPSSIFKLLSELCSISGNRIQLGLMSECIGYVTLYIIYMRFKGASTSQVISARNE